MPIDDIIGPPVPPPIDDNVVESTYEIEPTHIKVLPDGYIAPPKNMEWYKSYVPEYNKRNNSDISIDEEPSDEQYNAISQDFNNRVVEHYNTSNKKYNLELPEIKSVSDITPEAGAKVKQAEATQVLSDANKGLERAKAVLPQLKSFKPFTSIDDVKERGAALQEQVKKATDVQSKSEQTKLVSNVNNYLKDFNKQTGSNIPIYKTYEEAKKAITPNKKGETAFEQQLDVWLSEHPTIEPITLQGAKPIVDNTKNASEDVARSEYMLNNHIAENERASKAQALKEKIGSLSQKQVLTPLDLSYLKDPEVSDEHWYKSASEITSERVDDFYSNANSLMSEYKQLQSSINDKTSRGVEVSQAELLQYNSVKDKIQDNLDAAEVMQGVAKRKALDYHRLKSEQGSFLGGVARTAFHAANETFFKAPVNLAASLAPYFSKDISQEESEEFINKFNNVVKKEEEYLFGGTSNEYLETRNPLQTAVNSVVALSPYLIGGATKIPGVTFAMLATSGYASQKEEMLGNPNFKDLTPSERDAIAATKAIVGAVVMEMGLKVGKSGTLINNITRDALNNLPKTVGLNTMRSYIGRKAMDYASGIASNSASFGVLNAAGTIADAGVNDIVNAVKGKEIFEKKEIGDLLVDAWHSAGEGLLTGALLGAGTGIVSAVKQGKFENDTFAKINDLFLNPSSYKIYANEMKTQVRDGKISVEEAKANMKAIDMYKDIASQIPKDMSVDNRMEVTNLMLDNKSLEAQKSGLNALFTKPLDKRIAENNKAIEEIAEREMDMTFDNREGADKKVVELMAENPKKGFVIVESNGNFTIKNVEVKDTEVTTTDGQSNKTEPTPTTNKDATKVEVATDVPRGTLDKEQAPKEIPNSPSGENAKEEGSGVRGDVKWNNTGTEFKDNKFSKDGKTFSVKAGWNRFNRDLSISVLDENGKEVSVASFKQGEDGKFYSEGTGTTDGSFTEKDFRGKGLMKSVYDFVDKNYGEVKPSKNLTNDGLGFWESNRKQSIKETLTQEVKDNNKPTISKEATLADKIRSLKSQKGTLNSDITGGLKDLILEEIAQLVEDGATVINAIQEAFKNSKYAKLDKDEIRKEVLAVNPITDKDFAKLEGEKEPARIARLSQSLKEVGYTDKEVAYITKGGVERIEKVEQVREENKVVAQLNKAFASMSGKTPKEAVQIAIDNLKWEKGKEIILENAIRKFKAEHDISTPPSAPREKPILITVNEKKALIDQIKVINRSTKEVADKFKEVAKTIHGILDGHKEKISVKKLDAIQKRMGMLKVGSDEAVRKYVNYVEKVLADAEYADQVSAAKKLNRRLKKSLTNDKIPASTRATISDFLKLDPIDIADIGKHIEVAEELYDATKSSGVRVIDGNINDMTRKAADLKKINDYIKKETKVKVEEEPSEAIEKEDNSDQIKKYLDDKYKSMRNEVERMLNSGRMPDGEPIDFTPNEVSLIKRMLNLDLRKFDEVKDYQEVTEALDHLLMNGDMGLIPHIIDKYKQAIAVDNGFNALKTVLADNIKLLRISKFFADISGSVKSMLPYKGAELDYIKQKEYLRGFGTRRIDNALKNFKDTIIFDTVFAPIASGYSNYKAKIQELDAKKIERRLLRANGGNVNKTVISKFKITAYLRELEYQSNPNNPKVLPAIDYLKATAEASRQSIHPIQGAARDALNKIIEKNTIDGQVSMKLLSDNMTPQEHTAVAELLQHYDMLRPYHDKVSIDIRNKPFVGINNYSHINAYHQIPNGLSANDIARGIYGGVIAGTESGTIQERSGKASPINMDPFSTANVASREVLLDYFLTNPLRSMEKISKKFVDYATEELEKYPRGSAEYKNALTRKNIGLAIRDIFNDLKQNTLERSFFEGTVIGDAMQAMAKGTVTYQLARPDKMIPELASNLSYIATTGAMDFAEGISKYRQYAFAGEGHTVMENSNSYATDRLFPHGGISSAITMDTRDFDIATADNQNMTDPKKRVLLQAYYYTLAIPIGGVSKAAEYLITQGDLAAIRPLWFGAKAREFKRLTGNDIDYEKVQNNDSEYMDANEAALDASTKFADLQVTNAGASKNPYVTAPKMTAKNLKTYHAIQTYMRGFSLTEYETATDAIIALQKGGKLSRTDAVRILAGVTARAAVYKSLQIKTISLMTSAAFAAAALFKTNKEEEDELGMLIGADGEDSPEKRREIAEKQKEYFATDNPIIPGLKGNQYDALKTDDKETEEFWNRALRHPNTMLEDAAKGTAQQFVSMILSRNFGNIANSNVTAPLFEYAYEKIRNEMGLEYDKYKDNLLYSKFPDPSQRNWVSKLVENQLGPYGIAPVAGLAGVESYVHLKRQEAKAEELSDVLKQYREGGDVKDPDPETYYKTKDELSALEKKISDSKKLLKKDWLVAFGSVIHLPGTKNIDDILDKIMKPKYRNPSDINKIKEYYDLIKNYGVEAEDIYKKKHTEMENLIYERVKSGKKLPDTFEEFIEGL